MADVEKSPNPRIEVKILLQAGSEMAMQFPRYSQDQSHKARILERVGLKWPVPMTRNTPRGENQISYAYELFKDDVKLKDSDVLEEGDIITAVMSETITPRVPDLRRFSEQRRRVSALDLEPCGL